MTQLALPAVRAHAAPRSHRDRRDRRDAALAIAGLAFASVAFGAVVSGDPVPASGAVDGTPAPVTAGTAQAPR